MFYHWQVITVTGYTGTERTLLKNMIYVIGAKYTGYLTRVNTHIICKRYAVIYTVSYMYFCVTVIQLWSVYSVIGFDQKNLIAMENWIWSLQVGKTSPYEEMKLRFFGFCILTLYHWATETLWWARLSVHLVSFVCVPKYYSFNCIDITTYSRLFRDVPF